MGLTDSDIRALRHRDFLACFLLPGCQYVACLSTWIRWDIRVPGVRQIETWASVGFLLHEHPGRSSWGGGRDSPELQSKYTFQPDNSTNVFRRKGSLCC